MARLAEGTIDFSWSVKCGETDFCLGMGDYVMDRVVNGALDRALEMIFKELMYGGKHEQSRFSL